MIAFAQTQSDDSDSDVGASDTVVCESKSVAVADTPSGILGTGFVSRTALSQDIRETRLHAPGLRREKAQAQLDAATKAVASAKSKFDSAEAGSGG